jgi:uncharacterized protein
MSTKGLGGRLLAPLSLTPTRGPCGQGERPVNARTPEDTQAIIDEMVRRIVREFHPERIIVFGSRARGDAGPHSDVDLLIVMRDAAPKRQKAVAIYRLLAGIGLSKDIIIVTPDEIERFRDVPGTTIQPALREGRVLYERAA